MFLWRVSSSCCVWNSPGVIPRALASFLLSNSIYGHLWISRREMLRLIAAFRALKINLFHDVEWSVSCVHMGREWPDLGGLALCHMQRSPTRRDPYLSLPVLGSHRKTDTAFITPAAAEENIDRWYNCHVLVGCTLSGMPSLPVMPYHDFWPSKWATAVYEHTVVQYSKVKHGFFKTDSVKIQAIFFGIGTV